MEIFSVGKMGKLICFRFDFLFNPDKISLFCEMVPSFLEFYGDFEKWQKL
jgi:hypothetical protein